MHRLPPPIRHIVLPALLLCLGAGISACAQVTSSNLPALYGRLDTNHDGQLSKGEFTKLATVSQGKYKDQPKVFERLFGQLDSDQSGGLAPEEFAKLADMRPGAPPAPPAPKPVVPRVASSTPEATGPAKGGAADESAGLWRDAIDPEVDNDGALLTYQDPRGTIWLEHLDPATGLTEAGGAARVQLDTGAANLRQTFNGPEFGFDAGGWSVFYTKPDRGELQIWRARLVDGRPRPAPCFPTADTASRCWSARTTRPGARGSSTSRAIFRPVRFIGPTPTHPGARPASSAPSASIRRAGSTTP